MLYLVISYYMIRTEEEFLEQKYKEECKNYCRQVPRIFKIYNAYWLANKVKLII